MATREQYNPVPTVEPSGRPVSYQDERATSASFGGEIAQGEQRLGAGLDTGGNALFQAAVRIQGMNNERDAINRSNEYTQWSALL